MSSRIWSKAIREEVFTSVPSVLQKFRNKWDNKEKYFKDEAIISSFCFLILIP